MHLMYESDNSGEIDVRYLPTGAALAVDTKNSHYHLELLDEAGLALMTGGKLFPEPTTVRVQGSTAGGSELAMGRIIVGLRLECVVDGQRVVTSPVQRIMREM